MRSSKGSMKGTREPSGASWLAPFSSTQENSQTEATGPLSRVSRLELFILTLRTLPGLIVLSILWILFLVALVFGSMLLTLWAMQPRGSAASSTAVLLWASDLGIWTARRLYCLADRPCDASSPFSEDSPSNLRYVIHPKVELVKT